MESEFIDIVTPLIMKWAEESVIEDLCTIAFLILLIILKIKGRNFLDSLQGR